MNSFYVGLDIGGTHVRIVTYDKNEDRISETKKVAFKKLGNAKLEVDSNICELINEVIIKMKQKSKELKGIGLSVAALFNRASGEITVWPNNQAWNSFPLKEYLIERFNVPVVMEDDANSAALGEQMAGAGKGYNSLAYITISTGVGCGLILNNSLYTGANGWAGEIGHIKVAENGPSCKCGKYGCLQAIVSGPALLKRYVELKKEKNQWVDEQLDLKEVVCLALEGDNEAIELFLTAGRYVGEMIVSVVMMLDLDAVILGGGVIEAGDILIKPIRNTVNSQLNAFGRELKLERAQLGDNNGAIGSLSLIYKHVNDSVMIPSSIL